MFCEQDTRAPGHFPSARRTQGSVNLIGDRHKLGGMSEADCALVVKYLRYCFWFISSFHLVQDGGDGNHQRSISSAFNGTAKV